MSDKSSSDCCLEADTFYNDLFNAFIRGGTISVFVHTTFYLFDKTIQHSGEIKELFSRLEKKHESSQDHELKK